jgi:FHS family L-fucose permease-like MFS transporter
MIIFALIFVIIYFTPIAEPQQTGSDIVYERSPFAFRHFTLGALAIFCYMGIEIGVPATLVSYLKGIDGIGYDAATFMAGLFFIMMLIGRAIGSAVGGKVSSKTMVTFVASLAVVLMVLAIILGDSIRIPMIANWSFDVLAMPVASVLIMLVGLCGSVMWGSVFNLATEGLGKYTAKASGIFMTMVVGGGVLPYIQSACVALIGCLWSYIVPIIASAYIFCYAMFLSKNVNTDIKVD